MKRYMTYLAENTRFDMQLDEAQTVLVKYKIGEGGFGEVWRATHLQQPKNYALKHINVPLLIEKGRLNRDDKATLIQRIKREASVSVPSEFVVKCFGCREIDENFFILSEFVSGDKLGDWIRDHAEADWQVKKALYLKILRGVRDLHEAGIIHRDLKPSNILVTLESQMPKIIDFGLAKLEDSTMTISGDFSGSRFYKDPGLVHNWEGIKSGDRASDVYALGILLYEMIVGQNPWDANRLIYEELFNQIAGNDNVLDLDRQFRLDAPPEDVAAVQEAIRLSTRFDRTARLQTVDDITTRLTGTPPPSEPPAAVQSAPQTQTTQTRSPAPAAPRLSVAPTKKPAVSLTPPKQAEKRPRSMFGVIIALLLMLASAAMLLRGKDVLNALNPPAPTPTPVPTATPTISPTVALLERAQTYVNNYQFTAPDGENALEMYEQVLAIDPINQAAKDGIAFMLRAYKNLIGGDCAKAEGYYDSFMKISVYVHDTLRDDTLQEEAVAAEQTFLRCQSLRVVPRDGGGFPMEDDSVPGGERRRE